jgi:hypothetical protein
MVNARVAARRILIISVTQVVGEFAVEAVLDEDFRKLLEEPILSKQVVGLLAQLIEKFGGKWHNQMPFRD